LLDFWGQAISGQDNSFTTVNMNHSLLNLTVMKRILFFRNLLMSFVAIILINSCSKEVIPPPIQSTGTSSAVVPSSSNARYVTATNWVKVSDGNYKCIFYGLNGYGNELPGIVRVYLTDQNVETIISNGSVRFMDGELSASHDRFSVWVSFRESSEKQTLPFSTLKLKIVF
jgi:hypothetical protein